MKSTQSIIESILTSHNGTTSETALTGREIYESMEAKEKGFFPGGIDAVNKSLNYLRGKGFVENGISEIVNGRTVLTWKMKNAPILQKTEADKTPENIQDIARHEKPIQQEADATQEVESVYLEVPTITETPVENVESQMVENLEFHEMIENFGAGVNAFIEGTKQLIAELDEAKAEIERLKASHAIANKRETIAVLKHVQGFVKPINEDFDVVLGDIVQKIETMTEAA
jgi:hypothetical protein